MKIIISLSIFFWKKIFIWLINMILYLCITIVINNIIAAYIIMYVIHDFLNIIAQVTIHLMWLIEEYAIIFRVDV